MGILDYGRDTTDTIVREVGNNWVDAVRTSTPSLLTAAVKAEALKNDVDAEYLMWSLINDRRSWARSSGAEMLRVARRAYLESRSRGHDKKPFTMPDDIAGEKRVNKAIQNLIRWANGPYKDAMVGLLINVASPAADRIKAAILEEHGDRYTTAQARQVILSELPLRVRDHPFWFSDAATLQLLVQEVLG